MGRKRRKNRELPERVYLRGRQYVYLPHGQTKYIALGHTLAEAMEGYARLMRGATMRPPKTIGDCMDDYMQSPDFARLSDRTRDDYTRDIGRLRAVFGHMPPADLIPPDLYAYLYSRPVVRGNRELAVMANVIGMAIRAGLIDRNPCREVKRGREVKRTRLPTVAEVMTFAEQAGEQIDLYCRLKLMTGLRMGDMLRLDRHMIGEDALTIRTGKTGKTMSFAFQNAEGASTGLLELLRGILALRRRIGSMALFCTREGQHYTPDGWKSIWQRRMAAYVAAGGEHFREHDIRATAGKRKEDEQGREEARKLLGHDLESTTARYTGRSKIVKITPSGS